MNMRRFALSAMLVATIPSQALAGQWWVLDRSNACVDPSDSATISWSRYVRSPAEAYENMKSLGHRPDATTLKNQGLEGLG